MPTIIEMNIAGDWVRIGEINPGDRPGSLSDNWPDGGRELYIFYCSPDGSKTVIERSVAGHDVQIGEVRRVSSLGSTVVAELSSGQDFELTLRTDSSGDAHRHVRLRHE